MSRKFPKLFKPIQIKGVLIRNRVVMAPMNTNFAGPEGEVTDQLTDYFAERAKGGVGLIITSAAAVDRKAKKRKGELCAYHDDFIAGLTKLASSVQMEGAKIFLQVVHVGRELVSGTALKFKEAVGPSSLPHPLTGKPCRELSVKEIAQIRDKFISAARRAKEGGFDGVSVHGAHGYLLNQFTDPYSNRRLDKYGGGFEGRIRFPLEVVKGIRAEVGDDFLISYRMNGNEFIEPGAQLDYDESRSFSQKIAEYVDLIHVSTGSGQTPKTTRKLIPLMSSPRGCYAHLARAVKEVIDVPVISVGRINTPEVAESILARGDADMVAIGRGLIADPHWANKAQKGEVDEIRRCMGCNQGCMEYLIQEKKVTCIHNPSVGRERELAINTAQLKKKVLIIGGGVAGMEAARVARLRRHEVELWERNAALGGNANLASVIPWKREFKGMVDYLIYQVQKLGTSIKLNKEGTAQSIRNYGPDEVILATGAQPKGIAALREQRNDRVLLAEEILSGDLGRLISPVCIIGGGFVGLEAAAFVRIHGHEVAVVEMFPELGLDMGAINRAFWIDKMSELGIQIFCGCKVSGFDGSEAMVERDGKVDPRLIDFFSSYVIAVGYESNDALRQELERDSKGLQLSIHSVGDCVSPRNALHAIHEGFSVAFSL